MMQGGAACEETGASRSLKTSITCCETDTMAADGQATSPLAILVSIQVRVSTERHSSRQNTARALHAPHTLFVVLLIFPGDADSPPRQYDTREAMREGYIWLTVHICLMVDLWVLYLLNVACWVSPTAPILRAISDVSPTALPPPTPQEISVCSYLAQVCSRLLCPAATDEMKVVHGRGKQAVTSSGVAVASVGHRLGGVFGILQQLEACFPPK